MIAPPAELNRMRRHLRAADTALTRANARSLVDDWISNPGRRRPLERRPDVLARRVISLLSQAPLVLGDTDGKFYRTYLRGLTREIRYLRYAMLDIAGLDDSDLNIAYQGIAGINYAIGANTELTLAYRYLNVMDPEFEERSNPGIVIRFDDFAKHTLTLGLRYTYAP